MAKPLAALHRLWVHHKPTVIMMVAAIAAAVFLAFRSMTAVAIGVIARQRPPQLSPG